MPYKDPEKKKESDKRRYEKNKEKIKQQQKEYRAKNKDKRQEYLQTEKAIKSRRITMWKLYGLKTEDYDNIYELYMNTTHCQKCNIELSCGGKTTKTTKCLDHSHITGEFRNILCHSCNTKRRENNF